MIAPGTTGAYSYFEARNHAKFDNIVFFGLQYILKEYLEGQVVTQEKINDAAEICKAHFGDDKAFNRAGWQYILEKHGGKLPVRIKSVPEGSVIPKNNVLFTVENTDENCAWLTSYLESILSHVWASCQVASLARECKIMIKSYLDKTSENLSGLNFMLHCFGYRSVSSQESAGILGCSNLTSFFGTDTIPAIEFARDYYNANLNETAFSVPASEHQVMCALGEEGEKEIVQMLLNKYTKGILSVVADGYDYVRFIRDYVCGDFKQQILDRDGVFVCRPDSITPEFNTPESLTLWTVQTLWDSFGGVINNKGCKVLNSKVKCLWGDGINKEGIELILKTVSDAGFSVECLVFGMGGNYLQKGIYRDFLAFAFKSSSQCRNGVWHDVFKNPLDKSKVSKKGRLKLIKEDGAYKTVNESDLRQDELVTAFESGELKVNYTFDEVRKNAEL